MILRHRAVGSILHLAQRGEYIRIMLPKMSALSIVLTFLLPGSTPTLQRTRLAEYPDLMLWAWERNENLSFIDPKNAGVAFLAGTVNLSGDHITVQPRTHSLEVPPGTTLVAVVRVTSDLQYPPLYSPRQQSGTAGEVLSASRIPGVSGVQIDFDARTSDRAFYRSLLHDVRALLPESTSLSITALASWCLGDPWIKVLPVDDAVPMLFRMGPDRRTVLEDIEEGRDFSSAVCRHSIGISTDELSPLPSFKRRLYVFNPKPWTEDVYRKYLNGVPQ